MIAFRCSIQRRSTRRPKQRRIYFSPQLHYHQRVTAHISAADSQLIRWQRTHACVEPTTFPNSLRSQVSFFLYILPSATVALPQNCEQAKTVARGTTSMSAVGSRQLIFSFAVDDNAYIHIMLYTKWLEYQAPKIGDGVIWCFSWTPSMTKSSGVRLVGVYMCIWDYNIQRCCNLYSTG